ncbi:MAG: histidine kinase [Anaerovoracaceae bacterium]
MELANGCLEIFAALVILILLLSMRNANLTETFEKRLTAMVICHMAVLLLDSARWLLFSHTDRPVLLIVLSVLPTVLALLGNGIFGCFALSFLSARGPISRRTKITLVSLFTLAVLIWATFILLNGVESAANMQINHETMRFSWAYWAGHLGWASACLLGIGFVLRCRRGLKSNELLSLLSYCVFPLIALFLRFLWDGPQIFLSTSLSIIWIYAVMQREQRARFLEQENQLTQSRMAILLSQIQPHFLYNTLTAICGLCDENPKEAKKVTAEFADYLRHNLDSLTQSTPVPFEDELAHTRVYLSIEQKRFEERLHVVYDIERADFCVPSLTMQPLVENAVKHGVVKRKNGGTVTISTRERESCYEIIITDDGVGFDINEPQTDPDTHIGIQNVRDRLWSMCGGTLDIKSEVGKGTAATIKIPKGDADS